MFFFSINLVGHLAFYAERRTVQKDKNPRAENSSQFYYMNATISPAQSKNSPRSNTIHFVSCGQMETVAMKQSGAL